MDDTKRVSLRLFTWKLQISIAEKSTHQLVEICTHVVEATPLGRRKGNHLQNDLQIFPFSARQLQVEGSLKLQVDSILPANGICNCRVNGPFRVGKKKVGPFMFVLGFLFFKKGLFHHQSRRLSARSLNIWEQSKNRLKLILRLVVNSGINSTFKS